MIALSCITLSVDCERSLSPNRQTKISYNKTQCLLKGNQNGVVLSFVPPLTRAFANQLLNFENDLEQLYRP